MTQTQFIAVISLLAWLTIGCSPRKKSETHQSTPNRSMAISYAKGFSIDYFEGYKLVHVHSASDPQTTLQTYVLSENLVENTETDRIRIEIPLKTIAVTSSTHLPFLALLNELGTLQGVCSPHLIYHEEVRSLVAQNHITDLGDALSLNIEKVLRLKPQAIMISGYGMQDQTTAQLQRMGVCTIMNNEWQEETLLGRAEWIKFVAAFYNQEQLADSIFGEIEKRYLHQQQLAQKATAKPTLLTGGNFRGTWYVPSGATYMGKLFADAGANYRYATDQTKGSLPLTIETILREFKEADVWIAADANTLEELRTADSKHELFKAYQTGKVYNFYKRRNNEGGNDFWEMGVARPDLILSDMIQILHPELLPNDTLFFAKKLY